MSAEDEHMARFLKRFGRLGGRYVLRSSMPADVYWPFIPALSCESQLVAETLRALQRAFQRRVCPDGSVGARQSPLQTHDHTTAELRFYRRSPALLMMACSGLLSAQRLIHTAKRNTVRCVYIAQLQVVSK